MEKWQNPEAFAIWLALVIIVSMALVLAIIMIVRFYFKRVLLEQQRLAKLKFEYQEKLISDSIKIQERERERFAADLHDQLISKLNIIKLSLFTLKEKPPKSICKSLEDSISLGRKISHDLTPPLLEETSVAELFSEFLHPIKENYKISFQVLSHEEIKVEKVVKLQLMRIFQEVVSNILKHAEAKQIQVCLRLSNKFLYLKVEDDGVGFNPEKAKGGLGLKNIELRIRSLKAVHKFKKGRPNGSTFLLAVKL